MEADLSEPEGKMCCMSGRRCRVLHLLTGDKLFKLWSELQPKAVLSVCTSSEPPVQLTGLWINPEQVPAS